MRVRVHDWRVQAQSIGEKRAAMADERGPNGERLKPNLEKRMVRFCVERIACDVESCCIS